MTTFSALQTRIDGLMPGKEKKNKITTSFPTSPVIMSALGLLVVILFFFSSAGSAHADTAGPEWKILAVGNPTNFKPNDKTGADAIVITAINVGGASTGCTAEQIALEPRPAWLTAFSQCPLGSSVVSPVTVSDSLPVGLKAVEVIGDNAYHDPDAQIESGREASGLPYGMSCSLSPLPSCTTSERIDPGDTLVVTVRVHVETSVEGSSEINEASVSGGGVPSVSVNDPVTISTASAEYGVAKGALLAATSTSQAGAHPDFTTAFFLNTVNPKGEGKGEACTGPAETPSTCTIWSEPPGSSKDVRFDLPPGLLGSTVGMPTCTMAEVTNQANCPRDTMVGTQTLVITGPVERIVITVPVYNIAPAPGEPLAFAFDALFFPVRIDTSVLSDGEYNARVTVPDITGGAAFYMSSTTIWGDPAEHNGPGPDAATKNLAGGFFLGKQEGKQPPQVDFGGPGVEEFNEPDRPRKETVFEKRVPLLSNPTQCATPLTTKLETDSWEAPGDFEGERTAETSSGTPTGCGELSFQAGVSMLPDTLEAGAPAGYTFKANLAQNTEAEGLASAADKRTSATLPLGTVISPSIADGLGDCSSEQFFGPADERHQERPATPGSCPRDSQVGTASSKSPDLEEELTGAIYLAAPECTGPGGVCTPQDAADGKMVHLFLQLVGNGEDGIIVKQELTGQINQQTGQLTLTDDEVPEVPLDSFQLTAQGGERAALANPRTCGEVHTSVDLTPWSSPFTPDATPTSAFDINENCFAPQFNPSFSAGTTSNDAGGYSPFTVSFGRNDASEFLNGLQVQMPPGLSGVLANIPLCQEPQANAGTCSEASKIGEVSVETGPGADPFFVTGGKVYLTGPYKGAPYGLSVVVPAKAGPYTLAGTTGNGTVVNRSSIAVNPETAVLTVTADPLPTELDGIPLQLRLVNVTVGTGNNFTFNPTSCNKMEINGGLTSTEAAKANDASSFQVTNCAALKFQPKFSASTSGKTSKANGASLTLKVTRPSGPGTGQANFRLAKIELPKQLPSRLTTLQKACTAAVFNANPAACPAASDIGFVKVSTPLLPVPLEGPAYFVSHGGEAFPSVIFVLQGYGITIDAVSTTFISKSGITSATLKTIPDAPFTSFQLTFPEGKYSALAANGNLCKSTLVMPTEFVPQNGGAAIKEKTKIAVTGCPKAKKVKKKARGKKAGRARKSSIDRGRQS
jgi:hypothetical protein